MGAPHMASDNLPTPDELGDLLKAGEITRAEAIEIMSERARREALAGLYSPPADGSAGSAAGSAASGSSARWVGIAIVVFIVLLFVVVQFL